MALSVRSSGGYLQRGSVAGLSNAQNYSIRGAMNISGNSANGVYPVNAWLGIANDAGFQTTQWETYQAPPDDTNANQLRNFYKNASNVGVDAGVSALSSLYGKWIHWCWTHNATSNVSNLYMLVSGFNPASPSFLVTPGLGATRAALWDQFYLWIEKTDPASIATTIAQTAVIFCQRELTQAQVIQQFQQRAPIAVVTAVNYSYWALVDPANPQIDSGNTATNSTKTGTFVDGAVGQPTEWDGDTIMFGCEA